MVARANVLIYSPLWKWLVIDEFFQLAGANHQKLMHITSELMRIMKYTTALLAALLLLSPAAKADTLSDLKTVLASLQDDTDIRAKVAAQLDTTEGEGKETLHKTGLSTANLEHSAHGMKISYEPETLKQLVAEQASFEKPNGAQANTSTLAAVEAINVENLRKMTDASQYLSSKLARATFKNEQADTVQGQPARLLTFDLRNGNLSKKEQEYVKRYAGVLKVWLANDGTPLASQTDETYTGRAYLVVSFKITQKENIVYSMASKRLVATRYETLNKSEGGGEHGTQKIVRTLELQP